MWGLLRRKYLIRPVLSNTCVVKDVGAFFEPPINLDPSITPDLPHQLNGKSDCALSLHAYKFVTPIISIVEVKPAQIGKGIGQCLAEMYATLMILGVGSIFLIEKKSTINKSRSFTKKCEINKAQS